MENPKYSPKNQMEDFYYNYLFNMVDVHKNGFISGKDAVGFLTKSRIEKHILREIWNLSNSENVLKKQDFYTALRFVAIAQTNKFGVHFQSLVQTANMGDMPLPRFEGIQVPNPSELSNYAQQDPSNKSIAQAHYNSLSGQNMQQSGFNAGFHPGMHQNGGPQHAINRQQQSGFNQANVPQAGNFQTSPNVQHTGFSPGINLNNPGLNQTNPGLNQINPGLNPNTPGLNQTNPGLNQTNPGLNQTNPGLYQTNPGLNQTNPGLNQTNPGIHQTNPGLNQLNPGLNRVGPGEGYDARSIQPNANSQAQMYQSMPGGARSHNASQFATAGQRVEENSANDVQQSGFIGGKDAVALFQKSNLDRMVLRTIWSMSDLNKDNQLDVEEFCIAMHLIVCISKRGMPMPLELPKELVPNSASQSVASESQLEHGQVAKPKSDPMDAFASLSVTGTEKPPMQRRFSSQSNTSDNSQASSNISSSFSLPSTQFATTNSPMTGTSNFTNAPSVDSFATASSGAPIPNTNLVTQGMSSYGVNLMNKTPPHIPPQSETMPSSNAQHSQVNNEMDRIKNECIELGKILAINNKSISESRSKLANNEKVLDASMAELVVLQNKAHECTGLLVQKLNKECQVLKQQANGQHESELQSILNLDKDLLANLNADTHRLESELRQAKQLLASTKEKLQEAVESKEVHKIVAEFPKLGFENDSDPFAEFEDFQ